jgi:DNA-binding transcriptional LysR family regulator
MGAHACARLAAPHTMDTKWLEDFITLAETRSFSRAAELRNVTQPAFSRRIQALEAWLGSALVDRTTYPTRLTPAGDIFRAEALSMLAHLSETRTLLRGQEHVDAEAVSIAMPHTLSLGFFPRWVKHVERGVGRLSTKVTALNVHDAAMSLVDGGCDLAMVYHHASQPVQLDPSRFDMLPIGVESIYPYARCDEQGRAAYELPGRPGQPIPFLAYAPNAYLKRMVDFILAGMSPQPLLEARCETDMAEGLKAMLLEGHGLAFLPENAVRREISQKLLVCAGREYSMQMEIRIYCECRKTTKEKVKAIWQYLSDSKAGVPA